mgnify:CR=1 FL=1
MELSQEQIDIIINSYKNKKIREKEYYNKVQKNDENFILKNRERAKNHYENNKEEKRILYQNNKDFLSSRQLFYYYKKKDNLKTFETKHPLKYQIMVNKGYIKTETN